MSRLRRTGSSEHTPFTSYDQRARVVRMYGHPARPVCLPQWHRTPLHDSVAIYECNASGAGR